MLNLPSGLIVFFFFSFFLGSFFLHCLFDLHSNLHQVIQLVIFWIQNFSLFLCVLFNTLSKKNLLLLVTPTVDGLFQFVSSKFSSTFLFFQFLIFFFLQVWLTIKSPPLTCLFILFLFCFLVWFSFYKWVVWDMGDPTRKTFKLKCDIHQWTEGTKISKTLFWYFNFISFDVLLFSVMFTFI